MSELRDTARWLSKQLTANQKSISALSAPQLATSSIEAGTVAEYDKSGTLVSAVGTQFDGTHAAVTLAGPVPPEPNPPTVTTGMNTAEVRWDGTFANGALSPMDFSHVSVHASVLESFTPDNTTQKATISGESGDKATLALDSGEWYFSLVAVSLAGKWSDPSAPVLAEVQDFQQDTITDALIAYDTSITGLQTSVNGKNSITNSIAAATSTTPGVTIGDRWQKWSTLAAGGKLLATWRWDGTLWQAEAIDPTYLPQVDIGAGTFGTLDGGRLVANSVHAGSLETQLVLTTDVVAGNPASDHARMTPTGFKVLAVPAAGGSPTQVVSLGAGGTSDYLNVTSSTGTTVASIGSAGDMTANSLNVATDITIKGTTLTTSLANNGKGLMAWAIRQSDATYYAALTLQPYLSLQVDGIIAGRAYMVSTTPIHTKSDTANSDIIVKLHQGPGTRSANTSDPILDQGYSVPASWNTSMRSTISFNRLITPSTSGSLSLLLSYGVETGGRGKIIANNYRPVMITVTDVGLGMNQTGEARNGSADAASGATGGGEITPPPVVKNYDQTWTATNSRAFDTTGTPYGTDNTRMYSAGNMSSMAVFPDLTGPLAGATVTGVWVYVYYDYWYNATAGTAYIALHGQSAVTASPPALSYATYAVSPNWPVAAGRWVQIDSSTYAGWVAGTHKGFTLGGNGNNDPYSYAHGPQLRITWTK